MKRGVWQQGLLHQLQALQGIIHLLLDGDLGLSLARGGGC